MRFKAAGTPPGGADNASVCSKTLGRVGTGGGSCRQGWWPRFVGVQGCPTLSPSSQPLQRLACGLAPGVPGDHVAVLPSPFVLDRRSRHPRGHHPPGHADAPLVRRYRPGFGRAAIHLEVIVRTLLFGNSPVGLVWCIRSSSVN